LISNSYNPWFNLAYEEFLLKNIKEDEVILYLWQNDHTVVIGRNQNPWKECRCQLLESENGRLARRLSGGGAVYHDLGNLNFTFIMKEENYNFDRQIKVILNAVRSLDIDASFIGRNDLVVDGKKFSGNAFYFSGDKAYHHGTLLINTNFEKLVDYLTVSNEKIKSNGIDSVRSRVINLSEINGITDIEVYRKALIKNFAEEYGTLTETVSIDESSNDISFDKLYSKYSSWEWRYGDSPKWEYETSKKFSWGQINIGFCVKNGIIEKVKVYSDAMNAELPDEIEEKLFNKKFKDMNKDFFLMLESTSKIKEEKDIYSWLAEEISNII
jgi:lipoate-protein ligase A